MRQKSAPFSTHARGVPLFDRSFAGAQRGLSTALLDLRDMGSSIFWFLSMQSWLTLWSCIINIVSVVFYNYYQSKGLSAPVDLTIIEFVVVLPMIGFIWMLHNRRNQCLDWLSEVKCGMLYLIRSFSVVDFEDDYDHEGQDDQHGDTRAVLLGSMSRACMRVTLGMHNYFLPSRFYSTRYPYLGYKSAMYQIALDGSQSQRQMRKGLEELDILSLQCNEQTVEMRRHIFNLHVVIDKLCNAKEFGSPQGIRAMVRCYICIIIPVFFGPYWAFISENADFAVAFFVSSAFQIALTGLLNVSITLEDPFDNVGLCGIFIDEQLYEIEHAVQALGHYRSTQDTDMNGEESRGDEDGQQQQEGGGREEQEEDSSRQRVVRVATDNV